MTTAQDLKSRQAALATLGAVLGRHETLDAAFDTHARGLDAATHGRERAFAYALTAITLRRFGSLNHLLRGLVKKPLPAKAHVAKNAILLGLAQIFLMEVKDHAAVDTSVSLIGHDRNPRVRALKGLANAVLRRALREREALTTLLAAEPLHDLPTPLRARWIAAFGEDGTRSLVRAGYTDAPLDIMVKPGVDEAALVKAGGVALAPGHLRFPAHTAVTALPGFEAKGEGGSDFWVQDLAASLPVRLLDPTPGDTVADLCAAPGGKTMQIAAAGAHVTAIDRDKGRLVFLERNLARTGLSATIVASDVMTHEGRYDAVLLDAPCSATGTFRRHGEGPWIRDMAALKDLARIQADMLRHAWELVKPGGRLVYCTCSLEREEGEDQIEAFMAATPSARLARATGDLIPGHGEIEAGDGALRTRPDMLETEGGIDGFYVARIEKSG